MVVSANDAKTGSFVSIPLHEIDPENPLYVASAVVGSASIPFVFPPKDMTEFGLDYLLIDGSSTWNNNMISGIKECFKMDGVIHHSQIDMDVITLNGL